VNSRRSWLILGALVVAVAALAFVSAPSRSTDSPNHESTSDAPNGTSALRLYAQALAHRAGPIEGTFDLPAQPGLLFVFSPLFQSGYSAPEARQLVDWVKGGGVLAYAAESGDPQLDAALGLHRSTAGVDARALAAAPILGGVERVQGGDQAQPFTANSGQVPLFRNARGDVLAVIVPLGQGRVIAFADPLILANGYLAKPDNGRLAADLLAMTPTGGSVLFDEYHHGVTANASSPTGWALTPWGLALLWSVIIVFVGMGLRGRAFGPRIPLTSTRERSSAEYATAVGGLLRRAGARAETLQTLDAATRRALGARVGLSAEPQSPAFLDTLRRRDPSLYATLDDLERALTPAAGSDDRLLEVAGRLHEVAFPDEQARRPVPA
jgi:hypothetical protein